MVASLLSKDTGAKDMHKSQWPRGDRTGPGARPCSVHDHTPRDTVAHRCVGHSFGQKGCQVLGVTT